jgi:hypothetical protein
MKIQQNTYVIIPLEHVNDQSLFVLVCRPVDLFWKESTQKTIVNYLEENRPPPTVHSCLLLVSN